MEFEKQRQNIPKAVRTTVHAYLVVDITPCHMFFLDTLVVRIMHAQSLLMGHSIILLILEFGTYICHYIHIRSQVASCNGGIGCMNGEPI